MPRPIFTLLSGPRVLGECVLAGFDEGMGVALGPFRPAAAYEEVRSVFRAFAELDPGAAAQGAEHARLREFYRRRDELRLELVDAAGRVLPTGWIMVYDFSAEAGEDGYEWDAQITDPEFRGGRTGLAK